MVVDRLASSTMFKLVSLNMVELASLNMVEMASLNMVVDRLEHGCDGQFEHG